MPRSFLVVFIIVVMVATAGIYFYARCRATESRSLQVFAWLKAPALRPDLAIKAGSRCGNAPFVFPTTGVVGFLWDDTFRLGHRHQGIDIFAGTDINVTPVIAAYPGYLTRLPDWKSTVILRVPSDPLRRERQVWVYYTHMADPTGDSFVSADFPPGTYEKPVEEGTILGRQGDYSGDPNNPVRVHLHFSIVKDDHGKFMNELDINNTYDPSPYFGLSLNAGQNADKIPTCPAANE